MAIIFASILVPRVLIKQTSKKVFQDRNKNWQKKEWNKKKASKRTLAKEVNINPLKKMTKSRKIKKYWLSDILQLPQKSDYFRNYTELKN